MRLHVLLGHARRRSLQHRHHINPPLASSTASSQSVTPSSVEGDRDGALVGEGVVVDGVDVSAAVNGNGFARVVSSH